MFVYACCTAVCAIKVSPIHHLVVNVKAQTVAFDVNKHHIYYTVSHKKSISITADNQWTNKRRNWQTDGQMDKRTKQPNNQPIGFYFRLPMNLTETRLASTLTNFFCRMTGRTGWNANETVTVEYGLAQPDFSRHVNSSPSVSMPSSRQVTGIAVGFFIVNICVSFLHFKHSGWLHNTVPVPKLTIFNLLYKTSMWVGVWGCNRKILISQEYLLLVWSFLTF